MTQQFTASEVRDAITWKYGDKLTRISAMLRAFADLLEAQEKAVPVAYAEFADNGCVRVWSREYEERLPGTWMIPLYTHPAQAQPPAASVPERDEDPEEHCESGDASCGPVEFHDSEGVPLCKACWDALVADDVAAQENPNG